MNKMKRLSPKKKLVGEKGTELEKMRKKPELFF